MAGLSQCPELFSTLEHPRRFKLESADADEVFPVPTQFGQFWDSTALMASLGNLMINDLFFELGERVEGRLARVAELYGAFTGHVGDPVMPVRK